VAILFSQTDTHTHPFYGPLSGTTQVSRYQKGKTNLDFTEARDSEWQWHQLDHIQVCILLQTQTDNHTSTHHSFFYRLDDLPAPNQQRQSTGGIPKQIIIQCQWLIFAMTYKINWKKIQNNTFTGVSSSCWAVVCIFYCETMYMFAVNTDIIAQFNVIFRDKQLQKVL